MEKGIIIENISNKFKIKTKNNIYICDARGKFKNEEIKPLVGDNVKISITDKDKNIGIIEEILERKNSFKRPKMANIDQLVLVISAKMPKPDLLMLDKQLALAEYMKIKPIIVINKNDLDRSISDEIEKQYKYTKYTIIKTIAKQGKGISELKKQLKNKISAFSGNSGVGKSTLLNNLFNKNLNNEGEISEKNKKGKNTTTTVSLHELEENTYIADTPGFSNFEIFEIEAKDLEKYFIEFKDYIKDCEFIGCTHIKENECGIKKAVKENKISMERYERFVKIYELLKDKEEHKW